ncbi:MAG TPA: single-stranded DNA-binding protein [Candidatus Brocadiia bacterium]|nr:single-stranded DNA-binding protein [Planctomycetota bacterium]MBI4007439.1 single-stranded DNA-binding protein [Planctomycetota bacterium]MDO8092137.1 single-stranded DNA-binding protein [Candidatus Brocadiales bacterium]
MGNLNKVFLMGNLTRDPELRYTPNGAAVASFGIAVNRVWNSPEGEQKKETCFVDVSIFGKRAEVINKYFSKGKPIFIEGRLQFRQWETKDGQKQNKLSVVVEDFQFVGDRVKASSERQAVPQGDIAPVEAGPEVVREDVSDDEIPF